MIDDRDIHMYVYIIFSDNLVVKTALKYIEDVNDLIGIH